MYLKSIVIGISMLLILFGLFLLKFSFNEIIKIFALRELLIGSTIIFLISTLIFALTRQDNPQKYLLIISSTQSFIITTLCHLHTYFIN